MKIAQGSVTTARIAKNNCGRGCDQQAAGTALSEAEQEASKLASWQTKTETAKGLKRDLKEAESNLAALGFVPKNANKTAAQVASYLSYFGATATGVEKWQPLVRSAGLELVNRIAPGWVFLLILGLAGAEIGTEQKPERVEVPAGNDVPASSRKERKPAGNGGRKSTSAKPGNAESAQIIDFRKRPTREEILAFLDTKNADGRKRTMPQAAEHFRYTDRHLRNILNESSGSEKRQAAA